MNKQTFQIPECCRAITMEIIDNKIVTTFEPQFKRVNPETMQVEEIKKEIPMAKLFEVYYFVESNSRRVIESSETKDRIDSERHRYGNYFLSKEQAQRAAYKLKSALDEFWNEELK